MFLRDFVARKVWASLGGYVAQAQLSQAGSSCHRFSSCHRPVPSKCEVDLHKDALTVSVKHVVLTEQIILLSPASANYSLECVNTTTRMRIVRQTSLRSNET
jgi:hypothetical protein